MFFAQQQSQNQRQIDISLLNDYQLNSKSDWTNWQVNEQEFQGIPLGFMNKFNFLKNLKFCDLSQIQQTQEEADFVVVEENIKKKDKDFISKSAKMNENRQPGNIGKKNFSKKFQKTPRTWVNQIKTNFKKITVKNNWTQIKTISKNSLQGLPEIKNLKVENLKTIGNLNLANPDVERISWEQVRFKQNKVYTVDPIKTADDIFLSQIAGKLLQEGGNQRLSIICNPSFLFALLTVRAGVYPWNIQIQKMGNIIVLQNFKNNQNQNEKLSYLDLFTINENTSNNMPPEESKVIQSCIAATKMTKVFQDLLASGDKLDKEDIKDQFLQNEEDQQNDNQNQQDKQQEQKQQQLEKIRKYLKISYEKIDIYTYVEIDGAKRNSTTGQIEYLLIRTFLQSESQGVWIKKMMTPGTIITKQYHSNSCSIQKWICQARLAGVEDIKTGFIGYSQSKNLALLNVDQVSVKGLENTLSFKYQSCWSAVKYIFGLFEGLGDGNYVLAKNPYTPLSIKLYQTSSIQQQPEYEDEIQQAEQIEQKEQTNA